MPRRGECIYKRKDGRWEARFVKAAGPDGKKKYGSVYAASYRAVKEKRQIVLDALKEECASTVTETEVSLDTMMRRWFKHIESRVKPSTFCKYDCLARNHILPSLGELPVQSITKKTIAAYAENCRNEGRITGGTLSVKTVNDILVVLSLVFAFAKEEYGISVPEIDYLRETKKEARVLAAEEQKVLTTYLLDEMDIEKFGILLALYTGLRIGELCALRWEDITAHYVDVNKTMQRLTNPEGGTEIVIGSPKSPSSRRYIPIPAFLQPYVSAFRRNGGYVLCTKTCSLMEPRCLQNKFKKITTECGLKNVTFHTLRHTFATRCVEVGFDVKTLSEILGHSDVKTTLNRYVHSSFEMKQRNMEKLSALVSVG